jgi:hypothetical protein
MQRVTQVCLLAILCSSCSSVAEHDAKPKWLGEPLNRGSLGALSQGDCESRNGVWSGIVGAVVATCMKRVTDGGKSCSDHSQCESFCVTHDHVEYGSRTHGVCSGSYFGSGCIQGVANGRAEVTFCTDTQ